MNLHPKLAETLAKRAQEWRSFVSRQMKTARENALKLNAAVQKLEAAEIPWWATDDKIYVTVTGDKTKAAFSEVVKKCATVLGEAPDISIEPREYMADFKENLVHVYLPGAQDCMLIEVTETKTVTVMKPHPSCKAALEELEQLA